MSSDPNDPQREIPTNPENPLPTPPERADTEFDDLREGGSGVPPIPARTIPPLSESLLLDAISRIGESSRENREFFKRWHESERTRSLREEANQKLFHSEILTLREAFSEVQTRSIRAEKRMLEIEGRYEEKRQNYSNLLDEVSSLRSEFEEHRDLGSDRPSAPSPWLVLVVDDNDLIRTQLARLLTFHGLQAEIASTVAEAEQIVARGEVQVALVDLRLAHDSGMRLVREIRAQHPDVGVVILTGYITTEEAQEAQRLDVDVVMKPFRNSVLIATILAAREPST